MFPSVHVDVGLVYCERKTNRESKTNAIIFGGSDVLYRVSNIVVIQGDVMLW